MHKSENYPDHAYGTRREWLKRVRDKWNCFRKSFHKTEVITGCAYYPDEVYNWLIQFEKMNKLMKEYYKNA